MTNNLAAIVPGDVVILKGGSPPLTVSSLSHFNGLQCALVYWFNDSGELKNHNFELAALKHVYGHLEQ